MMGSTSTYAAWRRPSGRPDGSWLISVAAMARLPYFASVMPHVVRMEPDRSGNEVVHADITTWVTLAWICDAAIRRR
jgi:hypothetical protein